MEKQETPKSSLSVKAMGTLTRTIHTSFLELWKIKLATIQKMFLLKKNGSVLVRKLSLFAFSLALITSPSPQLQGSLESIAFTSVKAQPTSQAAVEHVWIHREIYDGICLEVCQATHVSWLVFI
jgi:hypothetical protein